MTTIENLKRDGEAPEWMTEEGYRTLAGGYLLPDETPRGMYSRVAKAAARWFADPEIWEAKYFDVMWKNWLCLASPVASNMGTERGLPISCLTGDSWITTKFDGGKQIKDIQVGDFVLTHEGRFRQVTAKTSRRSSGDLFELRVASRVTPTKITGNHPVLTNRGWVRVDELDPKEHFIAVDETIDIDEQEFVIDMKTFSPHDVVEKDGRLFKASTATNKKAKKKADARGGIVTYAYAPPAQVPVTNDVAWAIGLWLAEGSRTIKQDKKPNGARITMAVEEEPHVERWLRIMKQSFNAEGGWYKSEVSRENFAKGKTTKWLSASVNGLALGEFFVREFGINCKTKTIPQWVMRLPKERLQHLLDGIILGDGHVRSDGTWQLTLSNPRLILGVYQIALKLGIRVSLQMITKTSKAAQANGTKKIQYTLRSLKSDSVKFSTFSADSGIKFGKLRYCPIKSLRPIAEDEEVFDITVDEDSSFSVHGLIVHNCNSLHVGDSVDSIFAKNHEFGMLSKHGAGVGMYFGDIRARGELIKGNGKSEGVIPWLKIFDAAVIATAQGGVRRGAGAFYLPVTHGDIDEFMNIRRPVGDMNRRCLNTNHGICIPDDWMKAAIDGDKKKRELWGQILQTRVETGQPYLLFLDNVNNANPDCYKRRGLKVSTSNICTEIDLYTDPDHTFVCCLSSLNLVKYHEWKESDLVETSIRFLDAVLEEYIHKSERISRLEPSRRSAIKGRAVGLGVLGWHTLLQESGIAFDSAKAMRLNAEIFRTMRRRADKTAKDLAKERGEPEWCEGDGRRMTHTMAVAPTVSNSAISGGHSAGIEPLPACAYSVSSARGTFIRRNPTLQRLLAEKGYDTDSVWKSIVENDGSCQHLDCLSSDEKEVFLTAREINQHAIIRQAAQRTPFIDQGQSVNLFFASNASPKYIHDVHLKAWELGVKSLYYLRSSGVLKADLASRSGEECKACEG